MQTLETYYKSVEKELKSFQQFAVPFAKTDRDKKNFGDKRWAKEYLARLGVEQVRDVAAYAPDPYNVVATWLQHCAKLLWG